MKRINEIVVVEGKTDSQLLKEMCIRDRWECLMIIMKL